MLQFACIPSFISTQKTFHIPLQQTWHSSGEIWIEHCPLPNCPDSDRRTYFWYLPAKWSGINEVLWPAFPCQVACHLAAVWQKGGSFCRILFLKGALQLVCNPKQNTGVCQKSSHSLYGWGTNLLIARVTHLCPMRLTVACFKFKRFRRFLFFCVICLFKLVSFQWRYPSTTLAFPRRCLCAFVWAACKLPIVLVASSAPDVDR